MRKLICLVLLAGLVSLTPVQAAQNCDPSNQPSIRRTEDLPGFAGITGIYAVPDGAPSALVAMFHGYGNDSRSWVCHVVEATQHGAVAFALDYRGTTGPFRDTRGWFVSEGADDSIALGRYFLDAYPTIATTVSFGISMGGNASGLAVARSDIFNYWFDVEGVTNLAEEYLLARSVAATGNATAVNATKDIETECGGPIESVSDCYLDLSVVSHVGDFTPHLRGAVVVHGVDDGLVPHDQSRQIATELRALGIPIEYYTTLLRNSGPASDEGGTTLTQNVADPLTGGQYPRPLSGHAWEGSDTHIVTATAFARLWGLLEGGVVPENQEHAVNGDWTP